ncbi:MAG: DsrE/DsrF/DrsH-like family protein [Chloroflexi bacterium]|nr:DsrE/DsrF/DrsH-like family protein [Chloroflexota bacterium]MBI2980566.1 DsrE/DsrF/DrsH-like family protein [Chloroflexota bacterium]
MAINDSPDKERVTIILHSGAYDRAAYALSLALVSLASGMEVHMLLTFEGLLRFTRGHLLDRGEETSSKIRASVDRGLASGGIQSLEAQLDNARKLGLKIYACPNAMAILNIAQNELIEEVDSIMGLAAFLRLARTATINWYI